MVATPRLCDLPPVRPGRPLRSLEFRGLGRLGVLGFGFWGFGFGVQGLGLEV